MSPRPLIGRADLVLALAGDHALFTDIAERLGYEKLPSPMPQVDVVVNVEPPMAPATEPRPESAKPRPVMFWRPEHLEARESLPTPSPPPVDPPIERVDPKRVELSRFDPLSTVPAMLTRLQRAARARRTGGTIDLDRVVYQLSRAKQLNRLPLLHRKNWRHDLHVVIDLSTRLIPYRRDQSLLAGAMQKLMTKSDGTISVLREGAEFPVVQWPEERAGHPMPLAWGSTVLVLGDLGTLQQTNGSMIEDVWVRQGRLLGERECQTLAIVPCRTHAISKSLSPLWTLLEWDDSCKRSRAPTADESLAACERLLGLLSAAVRIEPRLLRAVRKQIPEGKNDPGLEGIFWQMCQGTTHCSAGALSPEQVAEFRPRLMSDPLKAEVWNLIEAAHRHEYPGVPCLEVVNLGKQANRFGAAASVERSRRWFRRLLAEGGGPERRDEFFRSAIDLLTDEAWQSMPELHQLWARICPDDPPPAGYDPRYDPGDKNQPVRTIEVSQSGGQFRFGTDVGRNSFGSPLARLHYRNPRILIDTMLDSSTSQARDHSFWQGAKAPDWATDWGQDESGAWCEFSVNEIRQRMRWIPPGEFMMGSPDDEPGRWDDEGPQHSVTISNGYWMFETPCTQELWQAVMGNNPSWFSGSSQSKGQAQVGRDPAESAMAEMPNAKRPVESVSWNDCVRFLKKLNQLQPGLGLNLPTEAQWEYACRANTTTATYVGPLSMDDEIAKRELQGVAWFQSNSGDETHEVGKNRANPWGLHDMLGNVWEWCLDGQRRYTAKGATDPVGPTNASADRVIRGGSWYDTAQFVRAAYRGGNHPASRCDDLGFRCSSSGSGPAEPRGARLERAVRGRSVGAEPSGDSEPASGDRSVNATPETAQFRLVPQGPSIRIRSDLDELLLQKMSRPDWASEMGRDEFGLWAEFVVSDVQQRLRWIPPGRFRMGSPDTEQGRDESEGPQHEQRLADGFWLFDTLCTQELWEAVMGNNPSHFRGPRLPVETVSWEDCQKFLVKMNGTIENNERRELRFSLPTETQWEYACRAGTTTPIWNSNTQIPDAEHEDRLMEIAWYSANSEDKTHDVATRRPNPWGLFDLLGNVWEWCEDSWRQRYDSKASAVRVIRGGGWYGPAQLVRAASRFGTLPADRDFNLGFRCSSQVVSQVRRSEER